ncbi:MAG: MFS transporter [Halanaerobiaceae bacterium]|nr:MFS transporter [Halanaerobiaceae bacterium]
MASQGMMGGALVSPGLSVLAEAFQISESSIGIVLSLLTIAAAISLPLTGLLTDIMGRRIMGITYLTINGVFGTACAFAGSFGQLLFFRFMQGIGIAGLIPLAITIASDLYEGPRRVRMTGLISGVVSISQIIIPSLGGVLAYRNWRYPFLIFGVSLLTAVLFCIFVRETKEDCNEEGHKLKEIKEKLRNYPGIIRRIFTLKDLRTVLFHSLFLYYSLYALTAYIPLFVTLRLGLTTTEAGLALALHGLLAALCSYLSYYINKILNWRQQITIGFVLVVISMVLIPFLNSFAGVLISMLIYGIGLGIVQPTIFNRVTVEAPKDIKGLVLAFFNSMKYIGMTLAPVTLRFIYTIGSYKAVFVSAALLILLWIFVFSIRNTKAETAYVNDQEI